MKVTTIKVGAIVLCILVIWYAWGEYRHRLSQAPPQIDPPALTRPDLPSFVTMDVSLPYSEIQNQLNQTFGKFAGNYGSTSPVHITTLTFGGSVFGVNVVLGTVSIDANWGASITNNGLITVAQNGDKIHFNIPVKVDGWAGLNGTGAQLFSVTRKEIHANFSLVADATGNLSPDYQPVIAIANVDVVGLNAVLEVAPRNNVSAFGVTLGGVGPFNFDLTPYVHDPLRNAIRDQLQAAIAKIQTDTIKKSLAGYWKSYSIPLALSENNGIYINLSPHDVKASSLIAEASCVRWIGEIGFKVAISDTSFTSPAIDLPPLGVINDQNDQCEINLPIHLGYRYLSKTVTQAIISQPPIIINASIGKVIVNLSYIDIYPSKEKLVVGVTFSAQLPTKVLSSNGVFWLTGRPVLATDRHSFRVEDLAIYDKVSNPLWSAGIDAAYPLIISAVTKATSVNFQSDLNVANDAIVASLQGLKEPIHCKVTNAKLEVNSLGIDAKGVEVDSQFKGAVSFMYDN